MRWCVWAKVVGRVRVHDAFQCGHVTLLIRVGYRVGWGRVWRGKGGCGVCSPASSSLCSWGSYVLSWWYLDSQCLYAFSSLWHVRPSILYASSCLSSSCSCILSPLYLSSPYLYPSISPSCPTSQSAPVPLSSSTHSSNLCILSPSHSSSSSLYPLYSGSLCSYSYSPSASL